ncbi:hypothetical protein M4951_20395 [Blastopirellula sp. J2-11]|uniref:hypothetical protein n=1 Tax=Blastopirellula sp. J2-11 TaxID=2943192 RepID=UPI0021C65E9B|nr:hypothetical protein [Blastopirellula sp. J2-11]UUO05722.1 hypothetical protein M4951_20395 [Blastopirellula sp. J2-11]
MPEPPRGFGRWLQLPLEGERWWSPCRAILIGIVGALINSAAIRFTQALGVQAGTGGFAKWFLAHLNLLLGTTLPLQLGPIRQEAFHTAVGVVSALIYAGLFYRLLPGPRWFRGLLYCQGMWAVQALVVLPWLGKGYLGLGISTTAPVWSWSLNALFGLVIGALYFPARKKRPPTSNEAAKP